ncbi:MAG: MotA/TolQ/ExbB proton channel family protein [Lachnospiraceae bacterium]|nr:MotA/TolQ/ExbB proton channel family protein [Lachnospiraceae bacterium]
MKNRLYFLLVPVYVAVFAVILYINGVFTGNVTDMANLMINVGFLLIIGVIFAISFVSFTRVNEVSASLDKATETIRKEYTENRRNLWEEYQGRKKVFGVLELDDAFRKYQKKMRQYTTKHGMSQVADLEDFIGEELLDQVGMTYFNSTVSGTMTGLGILGTFLGLSMGLGSFNGTDIYTISDNVGPLLAGMKVAFHTSVYGIFFSLVFTYVHRCVMSHAYEKLEDFLSMYRECVEPAVSTSDENVKAMLLYQANLANSMKELTALMKGQADNQIKGVETIVEQFTQQMEKALCVDFNKLGSTLNRVCQEQVIYAENYKQMEQTTQSLVSANISLQKMVEALLDRQENIEKQMRNQCERLDDTCNLINDEITNQLFTLGKMKE